MIQSYDYTHMIITHMMQTYEYTRVFVYDKLWRHVPQQDRESVIRSERRAYYDIIGFESTKRHVSIYKDPSTGHFLQTLQIV